MAALPFAHYRSLTRPRHNLRETERGLRSPKKATINARFSFWLKLGEIILTTVGGERFS